MNDFNALNICHAKNKFGEFSFSAYASILKYFTVS